MAIAHIQTKESHAGAVSLSTVTFLAAVTSGNSVVVSVAYNGNTRTITSVTDDQANSYSPIITLQTWNGGTDLYQTFILHNITNSPTIIQVNLSGASTSYLEIGATEIQGVVSTDKNHIGSGNSGTYDSGSITTSSANEYIWCDTRGYNTIGADANFTTESTDNGNRIQDRVVSSTETRNCTGSLTANAWISFIVSFSDQVAPTARTVATKVVFGKSAAELTPSVRGTQLMLNFSSTDAATYQSVSFTVVADRFYLAAIMSAATAANRVDPALLGNLATWTKIAAVP